MLNPIMLQTTQKISIKGVRDGLLISFGPGDFDEVLDELTSELTLKTDFFRGSRVILDVKNRRLERKQLKKVNELLEKNEISLWTVLAEEPETREVARNLGLATRLAGSNVDFDGNIISEAKPKTKDASNGPVELEKIPGSNSLLLQETLRSGRSISHEGHIVVIGDINPGAEVIAGGNVLVWGKLRGLVHAGAYGDNSAVICALEMVPTQLRIADQIAVSPGEKQQHPTPELVSLRDGQLVAETWETRR